MHAGLSALSDLQCLHRGCPQAERHKLDHVFIFTLLATICWCTLVVLTTAIAVRCSRLQPFQAAFLNVTQAALIFACGSVSSACAAYFSAWNVHSRFRQLLNDTAFTQRPDIDVCTLSCSVQACLSDGVFCMSAACNMDSQRWQQALNCDKLARTSHHRCQCTVQLVFELQLTVVIPSPQWTGPVLTVLCGVQAFAIENASLELQDTARYNIVTSALSFIVGGLLCLVRFNFRGGAPHAVLTAGAYGSTTDPPRDRQSRKCCARIDVPTF